MNAAEAAAAILAMAARRRAGATLCPSEVARALAGPGGNWRPLMPLVRTAAAALAAEGRIAVTQRGRPVEADAPGPIRLARPLPDARGPGRGAGGPVVSASRALRSPY